MEVDLTGAEGDDGGEAGEVGELAQKLEEVEAEMAEVKSQLEYLMQRQDQLRGRREQLLRRVEQERRAPKADWHQRAGFAWSDQMDTTLRDVFGLHDYRPLQREVMNASLQGRDVLCLLPSGGGKSLCYQLPALLRPGLTLVVSPLLSLIQDQVLSLRALRIDGACLTSLSSKEDVAEVYGRLERGQLKLLYVTPEKVVSSKRFMSKLEKAHQAGRLDRIAIDEAHCASQWGNDFRPDYKKLGLLKQQFPQVPILALTATATHQVCEDLKAILRIQGCEFFRASVNRPNLFYEVRPKPAAAADVTTAIVAWIREHYPRGESGIVYCLTRKDCEALAAELAAAGLSARHYHADMDPGPREAAHAAWSAGRVQVMVATIAFGMGINKPDVRFVVHHSLSKSVENYYQESGRAGRDGLPARCLLFYRFSDALRQAAIVCVDPTWQSNLTAMMRYASAAPSAPAAAAAAQGGAAASGGGGGVGHQHPHPHQAGCRRALIQRHFAEAPADCRGMCDNCCAAATVGPAGTPPPRDMTQHAVAILAILRQQQAKEKKATLLQLVELWRKEAGPLGKEAKALSKDDNEAVVAAMMYAGLLEFEFGFTAYATNTYLRPSGRGSHLLEAAGTGAAAAGGGAIPQHLRLLLPASALSIPADASLGPGSAKKGGGKAAAAASAAAGPSSGGGGAYGDDSTEAPGAAKVRATLEAWRSHRARVMRVFPHSVLSGAQLSALVALGQKQQPVAESALREAVGACRYDLHGKDLVEVLAGRFKVPPEAEAEAEAEAQGLARAAAGAGSGGCGSGSGAGMAPGSAAAPPPAQRQRPPAPKQQSAAAARGGEDGEDDDDVVVLVSDDSDEVELQGSGSAAAQPRAAGAVAAAKAPPSGAAAAGSRPARRTSLQPSGPGRRNAGVADGEEDGEATGDHDDDDNDDDDDDDFVADGDEDAPRNKRLRR
ncbi:hypothetical protein HXX76_000398 [Chlamydomonas incerta]|uniref:DNA 3'-5' helicase n=1 Tax=Chlamydomonas incerta TaxID=51695 RepID=A0A836B2Z3_CHLIN|nr:hypothetical protein HXX76_000398 [Chlamydomonas incerta]|eukprot:KAG2445794.1 hypothetical protein HXX76_000398 [Chlamydomonas incerta]